MARSRSSRRWLREHFDDPYTRRARTEGYRGRAAYKLIEIDERDRLLRPGMRVVDLGAAPGSWSQYAVTRLGARGILVASDLLPMDTVPGARFVQGDFREDETLVAVLEALGGDQAAADLVMSDMAPNMSGVDAVDQPAAMALAELAHDLATRILNPGGSLLTKMFQGEGSDAFVAQLRGDFGSVRIRKPKASRDRSREVYVLASNRKL